MKRRYRGLSVLISVVMVLCLFVASYSFADETSDPGLDTTNYEGSAGGGDEGDNNAAPVANDLYYTTAKNTELAVDSATGVLSGATDADGDTLSASLSYGTYNGSVEVNPDGSFTYTPEENYLGEDYFEFYVTDAATTVSALAFIKVGKPGVDIAKSVDKANAYAGDSVNYTVTVTNTGDTKLQDIIVYDDLVDKSWELANLEPLSSSKITYNYTIPANKRANDIITNNATVYANEYNDYMAYSLSLESLENNIIEEYDGKIVIDENAANEFYLIASASANVNVIERKRNTSSSSSTATKTYTLRMVVEGEGTVSPGTGTHSYSSGSTVQLSATPAEGWEFESWQGDEVNTSNQIKMNGNKSVTAVFSRIATEEEELIMEEEPTPAVQEPELPIAEIEDEEIPAATADVTELPKTGGVPSMVLYGLGGLITAIGVAFGSKTKKKEE